MKSNEIKKITKALNELQTYFLLKHYQNVVSEIKILDHQIFISLTIHHFDFEKEEEYKSTLIAQRNSALEEYSWELLGESEQENELDIVSSLFDEIEFDRNNHSLIIKLIRYLEY